MAVAFVFPGQGSQYPGMGLGFAEPRPGEPDLYGWASACLGWDLLTTLRDASDEELRQTYVAQPAMFVVSVAAFRALDRAGLHPDYVAGHSVGEFAALVAAGCCSFETGLTLVARRADLMQRAADNNPGSMSAVLGLPVAGVELAVGTAAEGDVLAVANDNAPGNVVVSGHWPALERLPAAAKSLGAKRVLPLNVGGAFHSPLMAKAAEDFGEFLAVAPLRDPTVPVVSNATAREGSTATDLRRLLANQLTGPVRWTESVRRLAELGVDTFVEVGPGSVLTGLVRRTVPDARAFATDGEDGIATVTEHLKVAGEEPLGTGQGEVVAMAERFVVSPGHGRFYPATAHRRADQGQYVEAGDVLGVLRNGSSAAPIHSTFRAWVVEQLAWEGDLVTPGQILLTLRPF